MCLSSSDIVSFQKALLKWFDVYARSLPWRKTKDPYAIWVSEVMLQQTQVETVKPYYQRFLKAYPTVEALAQAPLEAVMKQWEGLGYYSRLRNLHRGGQLVVERFGGQLPHTPEAIREVPGIGSYMAGAILSIAFDQPQPAVDGNVIRVITRLFAIEQDTTQLRVRQDLEQLTQSLIPPHRAGDFNQALMELGALVCKPLNPCCKDCPIASFCQGHQRGHPETFPIKRKKKPPRPTPMAVALLEYQGRFFLHQRQAGIFHSLWTFPFLEIDSKEPPEMILTDFMKQHFGLKIVVKPPLTTILHTLTHRKLEMAVYPCELIEPIKENQENTAWRTLAEMTSYALPKAHHKIIQFLLKTKNCGNFRKEI